MYVFGISFTVWIVPAHWGATRFINHPGFLPADREPTVSKELEPRMAKVFFMVCGKKGNHRNMSLIWCSLLWKSVTLRELRGNGFGYGEYYCLDYFLCI